MEENSLKVFVVDDEQSVVKGLVSDVDWGNFHCEIVGYTTDSSEALDFLRKKKIDVLVTDIYMPCVSGLELCKRARELQPDIFIIVISAYNRFEYVKEALKYEIVDYCLKPIDMDELNNCLRTVCMMRNNRIMKRKISYDPILRNSIFQRILREDISDPLFEEQCRLAEMDLNVSYCRVFLISTGKTGKNERMDLMNAFFEKKLPGTYCFLDAYMNLVILYLSDRPENTDADSNIRNVIREKKLADKIFLCMGRPLKNYRQIASGYQECLDFMNISSLFGGRFVSIEKYPYEKYLSQKKSNEVLRITNYLETDNWNAAEEIMIKTATGCTEGEQQKRELVCLAAFLVRRYRGNFRMEKGMPTLPETGKGRTLSACQMKNWLNSIYRNLQDNKNDQNERLHPYVRKAMSETDKNYEDKSLSLQEIARKCGVSASYLGFLFKEQTGEYFNDYLMKKRLDTAEFLLGKKELLISEVANKVGFSSQSYFNKAFRQKYGISPTEFRHKCCE